MPDLAIKHEERAAKLLVFLRVFGQIILRTNVGYES
jgi:hypothetical protein